MKQFTMNGQLAFAALSGDSNPIHVDPVISRRLIAGQPVVHGLHTVLWLLDELLATSGLVRIRSLKANFQSNIKLDTDVSCSIKAIAPGKARIVAATDTAKALTLDVEWEFATDSPPVPDRAPPIEAAHELTAAGVAAAAGSVPLQFDRKAACGMFPHAATKLPAQQFAALLASTFVVGMRVPGLHSLLNSIELVDSPITAGGLVYATGSFDERYSLTEISLRGPGFTGTVSAAVRPPPTAQASYVEIARAVTPGEFAGQRAVVIGGSRGLGEIAVKQLAAGGAHVRFSYHLGQADAERLAGEIVAGGGRAEAFRLDVGGDMPSLQETIVAEKPTVLAFFSTPSIAGAPRGRFDAGLFHRLSRFYVDGFLSLFTAAQAGGALTGVLQPSSIAITEVPNGMSEYAAAKAAAEVLVAALKKAHPRIRFHAPRWGRMPTDLTATFLAVDAAPPAPIVLDALRQTRGNAAP